MSYFTRTRVRIAQSALQACLSVLKVSLVCQQSLAEQTSLVYGRPSWLRTRLTSLFRLTPEVTRASMLFTRTIWARYDLHELLRTPLVLTVSACQHDLPTPTPPGHCRILVGPAESARWQSISQSGTAAERSSMAVYCRRYRPRVLPCLGGTFLLRA